VKALARQYDVAPKTIRRVLDAASARDVRDIPTELGGVTPDVAGQEQAPEQPHTIDVPGLLAEHLKATEVAEIREALRGGRRILRGQGYSVRVSAPLVLHQAALKQCTVLADGGFTPTGRKAFRTYADRIAAVSTAP
jgi:hypothetical protein